jgi:UDP-2,4-diacetamido-2,4,6-trideoxy-beta-L-altropyranose hydrolase
MGRQIVFRVDSSVVLGSGHVMRCLALADQLRVRGASVRFVCRVLPGNLIARIEDQGFPVGRLARQASETTPVLESTSVDWIVVDHYELGAQWEKSATAAGARVLAIEDLPDRRHDVAVFLDQNWIGDPPEALIAERVPNDCRLLLGPRYALLQSDYALMRRMLPKRGSVRRRVLVFFGGSDLTDETSKAVEALAAPEFAHLAVDVVLGANHPNREALVAKVRTRPGMIVHEPMPSLAGLMARADLFVGAGGSTSWERVCLDLPSVITTIATNQEPVAAAVVSAGFGEWIGSSGNTTVERYREAVRSGLQAVRTEVQPLVDGFGAMRVAELLSPSQAAALELRAATRADASLVFDWRNDPLARAMSLSSEPISWASHLQWFEQRLADRDTKLYIAEVCGLPIGQVRFAFGVGEATLSYALDGVVRGRGWSEWMIREALVRTPRARAAGVRALVKAGNVASRKIFSRLGWPHGSEGEALVFRKAPELDKVKS